MTAIAAIAVACALSVGPTATASASNWNHRSDYLMFPAPVNYTRCTQRHISPNARYWWTLYYERTGGEVLSAQDLWYWGIEGIAGAGLYDWGSTLFHTRARPR